MAVRILGAIACSAVAVEMFGGGYGLWGIDIDHMQVAIGAVFGYIALDILGLLERE